MTLVTPLPSVTGETPSVPRVTPVSYARQACPTRCPTRCPRFLTQLALAHGIPASDALLADRSALLDALPQLRLLRDVVFLAQLLLSPDLPPAARSAQRLRENSPKYARLATPSTRPKQ